MASATRYRLFAVVTPGFEHLLAREVDRLLPGVDTRRHKGGVELRVSARDLWCLARGSRLADGLRVRIGRFEARRFNALERGLARLPWHAYLARGARPRVQVSSTRSALYHSDAIRERVERVLAERLGESSRQEPAATVFVRLHNDDVTASVDASGERLHKRGYRTHIGKAPLRETLAAAVLEAVALPEAQPVWDPFCGSGTLPIELLLREAGGAAVFDRGFAFEHWPSHDAEAYREWLTDQPGRAEPGRRVIGSDRDESEIAAARSNAAAAGVAAHSEWLVGDVSEAASAVPEASAVLTNLPYGHRTKGGRQLANTLRRFGRMLAERPDLSPVWVLSAGHGLDRLTGQTWRPRLRFRNRGLSVALCELDRGDAAPSGSGPAVE